MSESDQQPTRGNSLKARIDRALPGPAASFFRPGEKPVQEPAPGLVVGKVIDDFKLIALIGQGGMGQVWEAEQISLGGRRLAVKFMRPERITNRQRAYFDREARAGARLSHRGIVTAYGSGETDGQPWIAMELVPGNWNLRDLLDNLAAEGQVPAEYDQQVAIFFHELACALQVAHEGGVIHRDLKPQNILITPEGSPKVTDFGLARIAEETALSATGDLAGTYFYMSPEQVTARRANIDHRSDIFSLGVLLYEMLALVRPFQGDTGHQVAQQIVSKDPPGLHTIRSRIPHDLVVITGKCLEKDPGKRYADTGELAEDLRRYLSDEPILALPPTRLDRLVKTYRRHPARVLAGAVGAVAFVVISGMSLSLSRSNTALAHSNEQLQTKTVEALASEQLAIERASQVLRLSLSFDHKRLMEQARTLWPAYPQRVPELEQWLAGARELTGQLPELRETRQALASDASGAMAGPQRAWWLDQLDQLIERIESLENMDTGQLSPRAVDSVDGWSVTRRLAFAQDLALRMAPGGAFNERWREALPAIAADYPGLDLAPQMGLVPIGKNADSGLWEFWHPQSGTEPKPDADGLLELTEESGFVFVLVPRGKFQMGTSKESKHESYFLTAALDEKPLHEVELSAFFLSKYEVSQAQWLRVTGHNPSMRSPASHDYMDSLLCAVESVSWFDAVRHLRGFGLALPSEAQWEYACRANSASPWPAPREDIALFANLRDQNYQERYNDYPSGMAWNDGFSAQAPIGSFLANEFGLHDMIGNLWEWCHDAYDPQFYVESPARDPVNQPVGNENRVERGGGYFSADDIARCSYRFNLPPAYADHGIGFRAARVVER